ncbi:hypothetical protein [Psychrobacter sp. I-STPA10]|uniref:hypothetical protein n=1 Tax=Psychrobacter sp. I-STPA10 TaxID=2585769 RepID=UPI001E30D0D2|nr:hypothetical protein [Psychrobacter sp. I-STPA10]
MLKYKFSFLNSMLASALAIVASVGLTPNMTTQPDVDTEFGYSSLDSPPPSPSPEPNQPKTPTKWWAKSKTMWFNIGVTAMGIAGVVFPMADSVLPYAEPFINAETFGLLTAIIGAGNVLLRTMTQSKITTKQHLPLEKVDYEI